MGQQAAIARLLVKRGGTTVIGTAFPVGPNLLITCRHILFGENVKEEQHSINHESHLTWFKVNKAGKEEIYKSESDIQLCVDLGEELDIVLLRCPVPEEFHFSFDVASHPSTERLAYSSSGYSSIDSKESDIRKQSGFDCVMCNPDPRYGSVKVQYEGEAKDPADWKGISGAPVYRGRKVYGVVTGDHARRNSVIRITSLPYCMSNVERFKECIRPKRFEYDTSALRAFIAKNTTLKNALAAKCAGDLVDENQTPECFLEAVTALRPDVVAGKLAEIARDQESLKPKVREFVALLLPVFVYSYVSEANFEEVLSSLGRKDSGVPGLPLGTIPWFESFMACMSNRRSEIGLDPASNRKLAANTYRLPDMPDGGINDIDVMEAYTAEEIANRLGGNAGFKKYASDLGDILAASEIAIAENDDGYLHALITAINISLEEAYTESGERPAYYIVIKGNSYEGWPILRAAFPYLALLKSDTKNEYLEEQQKVDAKILKIYSS